jgi:hypothetical protein
MFPKPGKIIQTHQFNIFSLENDGKTSASSYKEGTIKGLSFGPHHAARIPERQRD